MTELQHVFGDHYLVELIGCDSEVIKNVEGVKESFFQAAQEAEATVLNSAFHQFEPVGVTGFLLLAESHFFLHTWPQERYVAFDIFTCGPMFPERAIERLTEDFKASRVKTQVIKRGY
ncbi:adenosylmethionine decarboxylase [Candidatus Omnitrophota bacterium]